MSYTDFKEVANVNAGDSTHYGSDQLLEILKIFNNKIVANRRPNVKNPWRFSDRIELAAPASLPANPTSSSYIHLVVDPADFHLKVQTSTGALTDLQVFALETNDLKYAVGGSNVLGDLLKNNATKYVRFARGATDTVLTASSTDLVYQKIINANVDAAAGISWSKLSKSGSVLHDIANASQLSGSANGQVPTWNTSNSRWEPQTPPGSGTGEANTASNVGSGGVGVYKTKSGVQLQFKNINAGSNKITITDDTGSSEVDVDVNQANLTLSSLGGAVTDAQTPASPTGRTYGIDTNTIKHSTTNAQGDLLYYDTTATKYIRLPRGSNGEYLKSTATDIDWVAGPTAINVYGGINTQSGNDSTKIFNIAHGAGVQPTKYSVTFASSAAARPADYAAADGGGARLWVTATSTNLVLNYSVAPLTGTNNLSWAWLVIV